MDKLIGEGKMTMKNLNKDNFEAEVLQGKGTMLVDFFAEGCAPCEALMPTIHTLADKYGDKLTFAGFNIVGARRFVISQGIHSVPVIAIYQEGEKLEELVGGEATSNAIEAMIRKYI
jgi:thioredoxin 1